MIQAPPEQARADGRWAWSIGWLFAAAILVAGYGAAALQQAFNEPDNAMRLVEVRDFLSGQAWFDNIQHRLAPPAGVPMHWARSVDVMIGAPIALLSPLLGAHNAEIAVAFLYPFALLAAFMWLVAEIAGEIGARDGLRKETKLAAALVAALAFPTMAKFSPGSFDHHNVELTLGAAAVLCLIRMRETPWLGAAAGAALALMMATAAEGAPFVAAGLAIAGLLWLVRPEAYRRGLAWLGGGIAATSLISFLVLDPPSRWALAECDTMSTPFLGLGLAGGAVALALGFLPNRVGGGLAGRFAASAVLGGAALAALFVLFPGCAGGGYSALSADMKTLWMPQISESRPLLGLASDDVALLLTVSGAAVAGLAAAVIYLRKRWRHAEGWIAIGFLVTAWVLLLWQIRGAAFATAFAIPFGGWAVTRARLAFRVRPNAIRALAFLGVAGSSAAAAWAGVGDFTQQKLIPHAAITDYKARKATAKDCADPAAITALNKVTPGVIMGPFSFGPTILQRTQHSVLAAPYHRGGAGVMAMITAMRSSPEAARAVIAKTKTDYVVFCAAAPEATFYARHPAGVASSETLAARLSAGTAPDWLEPVDIGAGALKLYRVRS